MRFPQVLLIGAMKAGTTGLYLDLAEHPEVFLADDKEPEALCTDRVLSDDGRRQYARNYTTAKAGQILIDASTAYTKRPDFEGVPKRATSLLPEGFNVLYMVRQPIERIISQYHHEFSEGKVGPDIDKVIREHSRYLAYSSYAYQLQPWLEAVGPDRVKVVRFEDYKDRRQEVVADVLSFLGLSPQINAIDADKVYNKSQGKPVLSPFWGVISANPAYRKLLRPLLPVKLRMKLLERVLPKAPQPPAELGEPARQWLRDQLRSDVSMLSQILCKKEAMWEEFADQPSG